MGFLNWLSNRHAREVQADMKIMYSEMEAIAISLDSLKQSVHSLAGKINRMKRGSDAETENPTSQASQSQHLSKEEDEFLRGTWEFQQMERAKNFGNQ